MMLEQSRKPKHEIDSILHAHKPKYDVWVNKPKPEKVRLGLQPRVAEGDVGFQKL